MKIDLISTKTREKFLKTGMSETSSKYKFTLGIIYLRTRFEQTFARGLQISRSFLGRVSQNEKSSPHINFLFAFFHMKKVDYIDDS